MTPLRRVRMSKERSWKAHPPVDTDYQQLFHEYNVRFFASRLPAYRVHVVDKVTVGRIYGTCAGHCNRRSRLIRIRNEHDREVSMEETMIHEMVHASVGYSHGKKFLAEMRRLHALGAPVQDLEVLSSRGRLSRQDVEDFGVDCFDNPADLTLKNLVNYLHQDLGYGETAHALRRGYPWLRPALARVRRNHRRIRQTAMLIRQGTLSRIQR